MAKLRNITDETLDVPLVGRHVAPDEQIEVSDAIWAQHAWPETVWEEVEVPRRVFDPSNATVDEVLAHLDKSDDDERDRVLAAERAGKARKGILGEEQA